MQGDTQANHLAKRILECTNYPSYELALPYVKMDTTYIEELEKDDVLLLNQQALEFIFVQKGRVKAKGVLKMLNAMFVCEITERLDEIDQKNL